MPLPSLPGESLARQIPTRGVKQVRPALPSTRLASLRAYAASDAKFCELGLMPAAGAEFQRKQSILLGKSPFPLVESTPERSKAGLTYH